MDNRFVDYSFPNSSTKTLEDILVADGLALHYGTGAVIRLLFIS